jgi:hypothetical protein
MSDIPHVIHWAGRPIDSLSHEELLQAFAELSEMYEEANSERFRRAKAMASMYRVGPVLGCLRS